MKTKYKLIKEYPGSPCIGTIKEVETREGRVLTCKTWELYNIYPEFWEEVEPVKTPLFITEDDVAIYEENKKSCWIMDTDFNLHPYPYIGFKTFSTKQKTEEYIAKNKMLFITEDGIPIYVGDEYWLYNELTFNLIKGCAKWSSPTEYSHMKTIYFSTKQAAENYIARNKVVFVTEDGVNVYSGDTFYFVDYYFEIGRGKAISGTFSKLSDYKEFSTKEKAQEYINMLMEANMMVNG